MSRELPLSHKLYFDALYVELAKAVGYAGFPVCELAERLRPLTQQHGANRLSAAFSDVLSFAGNRVMLSEKARKLCFGLLGCPPERWASFYAHTKDPPASPYTAEIPDREIDPITDGLRILTAPALQDMLESARRHRKSRIQHIADLATEQVPRIESELLRRGMDCPEEKIEEPTVKKTVAKKRKKAG